MNTAGYTTLVGTEIIKAINWIIECDSSLTAEDFEDATDLDITRMVSRNYSGGINAFRLDYLTE